MSSSLTEYYVRSFDSNSFFGLQMVINWMSMLVFLWVLGLAYLVLRANSRASENRFMAVLLICEGMKMLFQAVDIIPYLPQFEPLWNVIWLVKIDVFIIGTITSIFLYLSIPVYYRIERLKFLHRSSLQRHMWYSIPIFSTLFWIFLRNIPFFQIPNRVWFTCSSQGAQPEVQTWTGEFSSGLQEIVNSIGTCPATIDTIVATESIGLWLIALIGTPVSILALLLIRSSIKKSKDGNVIYEKESMTSNSLYIGFLGKVIGNILFFSAILFVIPLLNGGPAGFIDVNEWRYAADRTFMSRLKYFVWTFSLMFQVSGVAFEAMMFVNASLKDTVFGIDKNLRTTFRNAVFTGIGAFLFILGSEVMENLLGFGLAGGVFIGISLVIVRKPVISIIDSFSGRLLSSDFSKEDLDYIKAYSEAARDGKITDKEKSMLETFASAYGLNPERVTFLENYYDSSNSEENEDFRTLSSGDEIVLTSISEISVIQQWTDDSGYTWRKMSNGATQWWNGTDWVDYQ